MTLDQGLKQDRKTLVRSIHEFSSQLRFGGCSCRTPFLLFHGFGNAQHGLQLTHGPMPGQVNELELLELLRIDRENIADAHRMNDHQQIGGFERLADDCELSKETIAAVRAINNQYGRYTQWLMVLGSGNDKIIEMAEVHASPTMVWANTNDTNEANARRLVENLRPDLPLAFVVSWLAQKYPRGLTAAGLTNLSETDLAEIQTGGIG